MRYLARYAATEAGLLRVLERRVSRWAYAATAEPEHAAQAKQAARAVVARLVAAGAIDDAAFAAIRARTLTRAGRSRRAVLAHLTAKGVPGALTDAVPEDPEAEFDAALAYARRRRMGPFRPATDAPPDLRMKELARLARAGFPQDIASRALDMDPHDAEARLLASRQA